MTTERNAPGSCGAPVEVSVAQVDAGAAGAGAHAGVQRQQKLARRTVGAVNDEAPAEPVGLGANFGTVALDARLVLLAPGFGTADRDRMSVLGIDEFHAAGERECLLGRIEFFDPEDGHSITVGRAETWRADYQARLERHRAEIRAETDRLGWSFIIHRTDRPATDLLLKLHAQMGAGSLGSGVSHWHAGAPSGIGA